MCGSCLDRRKPRQGQVCDRLLRSPSCGRNITHGPVSEYRTYRCGRCVVDHYVHKEEVIRGPRQTATQVHGTATMLSLRYGARSALWRQAHNRAKPVPFLPSSLPLSSHFFQCSRAFSTSPNELSQNVGRTSRRRVFALMASGIGLGALWLLHDQASADAASLSSSDCRKHISTAEKVRKLQAVGTERIEECHVNAYAANENIEDTFQIAAEGEPAGACPSTFVSVHDCCEHAPLAVELIICFCSCERGRGSAVWCIRRSLWWRSQRILSR